MAKPAKDTQFKLRPLADRVVVKREESREEKTESGIVIPDTAQDRPTTAEVVAVGPGKRDDDGDRIPLEVEAGDRVVISKYGGSEVNVDGKEYAILRADDILAVFEE